MIEPYYNIVSESEKSKEKQKARELKKTHWWKLRLQKAVCYYCEKRFSQDLLTMDHKVPISRGGKSQRSNVVVCCEECNYQKKNATPVEMLLK